MNQTLAVTKIEAVEEIGPGIFEVRVLLEDASTATLRMNGGEAILVVGQRSAIGRLDGAASRANE